MNKFGKKTGISILVVLAGCTIIFTSVKLQNEERIKQNNEIVLDDYQASSPFNMLDFDMDVMKEKIYCDPLIKESYNIMDYDSDSWSETLYDAANSDKYVHVRGFIGHRKEKIKSLVQSNDFELLFEQNPIGTECTAVKMVLNDVDLDSESQKKINALCNRLFGPELAEMMVYGVGEDGSLDYEYEEEDGNKKYKISRRITKISENTGNLQIEIRNWNTKEIDEKRFFYRKNEYKPLILVR